MFQRSLLLVARYSWHADYGARLGAWYAPTRAETSCPASFKVGIRSRSAIKSSIRSTGPETLRAAMTFRLCPQMGIATHLTPGSCSWQSMAYPRALIFPRSAMSWSMLVIV